MIETARFQLDDLSTVTPRHYREDRLVLRLGHEYRFIKSPIVKTYISHKNGAAVRKLSSMELHKLILRR